jgi:transposase
MAQRGRRLPVHSLDVMVYQVEVLKRPALQVALDNLVSVEVVKCACKRKRDTGSADYAPRGRMGPRPAYGDNDLLYLDSRVQEGHATDTTAEHMQALLCGTGLRASRRMLGAMYNDLRLTWKKVRRSPAGRGAPGRADHHRVAPPMRAAQYHVVAFEVDPEQQQDFVHDMWSEHVTADMVLSVDEVCALAASRTRALRRTARVSG